MQNIISDQLADQWTDSSAEHETEPGYRYAAVVEYDGAGFGGRLGGWQAQAHCLSVQECLQQAVAQLTQENVTVFGAGRTDAGVHATGQVVHFTLNKTWHPGSLQLGLNHWLKERCFEISFSTSFKSVKHLYGQRAIVSYVQPIALRHLYRVPLDFHARFSALARQYHYLILSRNSPSPLWANKAWWIHRPLNVDSMNQGAAIFHGTHDFSNFRHGDCQSKTPTKTLHDLSVHREGEVIRVTAKAPSFLHGQVRRMVGALVYVGVGKWSLQDLQDVLMGRKPYTGAKVAPSWGLCLQHVLYPQPLDAYENESLI